jgi:CubicO group peptidase (beta-lactamase class C family)
VNLEEFGQITSLLVSRGGELVHEQYLDGDAETLRNTRSCTKTVAGLLLGIAIERNSFSAGSLLFTSRALARLGMLASQEGAGIVPAAWLAESTRAHARIDDETEYGYLWWLRSFAGQASCYMTGTGGNRAHVFPSLDLVVVVTTTNFGVPGAHQLSDRLLVERVLPVFA